MGRTARASARRLLAYCPSLREPSHRHARACPRDQRNGPPQCRFDPLFIMLRISKRGRAAARLRQPPRLVASARLHVAWQKARAAYLARHPLCVFCERDGRVTAAAVVDHIEAHRGDPCCSGTRTIGNRSARVITTAPSSGRRNWLDPRGWSKVHDPSLGTGALAKNFCVREIWTGGSND